MTALRHSEGSGFAIVTVDLAVGFVARDVDGSPVVVGDFVVVDVVICSVVVEGVVVVVGAVVVVVAVIGLVAGVLVVGVLVVGVDIGDVEALVVVIAVNLGLFLFLH